MTSIVIAVLVAIVIVFLAKIWDGINNIWGIQQRWEKARVLRQERVDQMMEDHRDNIRFFQQMREDTPDADTMIGAFDRIYFLDEGSAKLMAKQSEVLYLCREKLQRPNWQENSAN